MSADQHARIFYAYLARLSHQQLRAVVSAQEASWFASMHYGNSGQLEAQKLAQEAVERAVGSMLPHDIANIEAIIGRNEQRAETKPKVDLELPLPNADDFPHIVVGQEYEFHAEMQEAEVSAHERMRNYTGQKVMVISGPEPKEDPADPEASDYFVVRAADGREFTAAEEELSGWNKVLGQFFWSDGTYGPSRDRRYLINETIRAAARSTRSPV